MQRNMIFYALLALGPFAVHGDVREEFGRIDVDPVREEFGRIDVDKDGSISFREYEAVRNYTYGEAPNGDARVWAVCGSGWVWNPDTVYMDNPYGVQKKCGDLADWCEPNQNTEACQEDPTLEEKSVLAEALYRAIRDRRCCTHEDDVWTFNEVQTGKRRRNQPSYPTEDPTNEPTAEPTEDPTNEPTANPTKLPTTRYHVDSQDIRPSSSSAPSGFARSGFADGNLVNDVRNLVADKPAPIRRRSTLKRFLPHL